ncbi:YVTN family beta-propeller protein [Anaerosolibacter carboniphilus]|uniref:YVTN family beta-propeller protein n=1 Tax=Anaerosolibacter carboniphilus TaxID=1417629 RepID=A0A841KR33_9FIRM|nr:DNRLRE domain-containing protein [Anaerosolibacter carboniphilus]MBB6215877.1 YVTN family beta-propeller protein [Anaerosolibacter carboniphilus]
MEIKYRFKISRYLNKKMNGGIILPVLFLTPIDATIVAQLQPDQNFGPQEDLFVGRTAVPNDVFRSLLKFDISVIPPEVTITKATLRLFFFQKDVPGVQPLSVQRLTSNFSQNTVTWNTQPATGGTIYETNLTEDNLNNFIYLDVTGLAEDWFSGSIANNGLLLTTIENATSLMGFKGYDDAIVPNLPTLIIEFEEAPVMEECSCANLLNNITPGSVVEIVTRCNTFVGQLVGPVTPDVIQLVTQNNRVFNICCKEICTIGSLELLPLAYVTNLLDDSVSVINTAINSVITTIVNVGDAPIGVAITPDGTKAYVTNASGDTVSVINTLTNSILVVIPVGGVPNGVAITPDGTKAYVTNVDDDTVSVINTLTNSILVVIPVGDAPVGVAITPDGAKAYVVNFGGNVSVIDIDTDTVIDTIDVGTNPQGVAITPDGTKAYVTNLNDNTVSIIDTDTDTVIDTIGVGANPISIAITPDGSKAYVTNASGDTVSVINTMTDSVFTTVAVGDGPRGIDIALVPVL